MNNHDSEKIIMDNYTDKDVVKNAETVRHWIHSVSEVRNRCAHYERLYDSKFKRPIKLPNQYKKRGIENSSLFAHLIMFKLLINSEMLWDNFIDRFDTIIDKYKFKNLYNMGFSNDWKEILARKKD